MCAESMQQRNGEAGSGDAYFLKSTHLFFCLKIICLEVLAISKQELQINEEIRDREILVIDQNGTKLGTMSARDAQKLAYEQDLDLVKIAPQATPPVCRIMDLSLIHI